MKIQVETQQVRAEYLPDVQYCYVRDLKNHGVITPTYGKRKEKAIRAIFEGIGEKSFAEICKEFIGIGCKINHRVY